MLSMENKRKNIYIVVFIITTIIASCVAVYFGVMWNNDKQTLEAKIQEMSSQSNMTNKEEKNNVEKEESDEKVVYKYTRPTIDVNKCINAHKDAEYQIIKEDSMSDDISCSVNKDKKSVTLSINWENMKKMYQINQPNEIKGNSETVTIDNFSNEIIDVCVVRLGQGIGNETILFLMEDGTVEYIPIYRALKNKEYKSYGELNGLDSIVDVSKGSAVLNNNSEYVGGHITVFAIKEDGSFYDLYEILENTGNYNNF